MLDCGGPPQSQNEIEIFLLYNIKYLQCCVLCRCSAEHISFISLHQARKERPVLWGTIENVFGMIGNLSCDSRYFCMNSMNVWVTICHVKPCTDLIRASVHGVMIVTYCHWLAAQHETDKDPDMFGQSNFNPSVKTSLLAGSQHVVDVKAGGRCCVMFNDPESDVMSK